MDIYLRLFDTKMLKILFLISISFLTYNILFFSKKKTKKKKNKKQRKQKKKNKNITKQNKNLQHFINSLPTITNSWNFPKTNFLKIKFKFKFVIKFIHFKYTFGSAVSTSTIPFFLMNLLGYYYPFVVKGLWVLINSTSKVFDSWIRY